MLRITLKVLIPKLLSSMALKLVRPLCVFDLETTGLQITKDRIVQIAVIKLFPDGRSETFNELVNPGQTIPAEITAIHGISNEMVANAPSFEAIAPRLLEFIDDSDLAGYNSNKFDIPVLSEELLRCGIEFDLGARHFVDVQNMYDSAKNLYSAKVNFSNVLKEGVASRKLIRAFAYVIKADVGEEKNFFEALNKIGFEV